MLLEINELLDAVALGEPWHQTLTVFVDSPDQIVGDTDIERAMTMLSENVDIEQTHACKVRHYWAPGTSPGVTA